MKHMLQDAAVAGIGRTRFVWRSGRTPLAMAADALADCGLTPADVDGFIAFDTGTSLRPSQAFFRPEPPQ